MSHAPLSPRETVEPALFLRKIQENHGSSLMAITLARAEGGKQWLFAFDAHLASRVGALIGAGGSEGAFCLDLTHPQTAAKHSNTFEWSVHGFFDDEGPDSKANRERLFELVGAGLSLHLGSARRGPASFLRVDLLNELGPFLDLSGPLACKTLGSDFFRSGLVQGLRVDPAWAGAVNQKLAFSRACLPQAASAARARL